MDREAWLSWLNNVKARVRIDAPMRDRTSYRIGGRAGALVAPEDLDALQEILARGNAERIPIRVVGGGTNLLVSDRGFRGIVVTLGKGFDEVKVTSLRRATSAGELASRAPPSSKDRVASSRMS